MTAAKNNSTTSKMSLAPGLLVAAPSLGDPHFAQALILLVMHNNEGALGIVINHERTLAHVGEIFEQLDLPNSTEHEHEHVRLGGPVQPEVGWIVYRPTLEQTSREGEIAISETLAVSQSRELLSTIAHKKGPQVYSMYLGYTGWAPGQLENEIRAGSWLPLDLDESLIMDVPVAQRWSEAFKRAGLNPIGMIAPQCGLA